MTDRNVTKIKCHIGVGQNTVEFVDK